MLASSLKGIVAQTLCKRPSKGRIAALEVLIVNNAICNQIREGKTFQIELGMQVGRKEGNMLMNDALVQHVMDENIMPEEAVHRSLQRADLIEKLSAKGIKVSDDDDA